MAKIMVPFDHGKLLEVHNEVTRQKLDKTLAMTTAGAGYVVSDMLKSKG